MIQSLRDRSTILGYIKGFEITRPQNSFNECHPHYHIMIAMTSEYFDRFYIEQQEWRSRWQRAARLDYDPWVRVRKVSNIKSGILETIKYELKPENYVSSWLWTARLAIANKGTQRVSYGGIFREHLRFLKYDPQDLIHECDNELNYSPGGEGKRYMFKWDAKLKHHIYHQTEEISIL
ncbi:MAG: protein rep [Okeania sp. SIO2H7]|nr:protein rep [Okeania sp. SIO2H7]